MKSNSVIVFTVWPSPLPVPAPNFELVDMFTAKIWLFLANRDDMSGQHQVDPGYFLWCEHIHLCTAFFLFGGEATSSVIGLA